MGLAALMLAVISTGWSGRRFVRSAADLEPAASGADRSPLADDVRVGFDGAMEPDEHDEAAAAPLRRRRRRAADRRGDPARPATGGRCGRPRCPLHPEAVDGAVPVCARSSATPARPSSPCNSPTRSHGSATLDGPRSRFARLVASADLSAFSVIDRLTLRIGATLAPIVPRLVMPLVERRLRAESAEVVLPADDPGLGRHLADRRRAGMRPNVNILGEAIVGDDEARARLDAVLARLAPAGRRLRVGEGLRDLCGSQHRGIRAHGRSDRRPSPASLRSCRARAIRPCS